MLLTGRRQSAVADDDRNRIADRAPRAAVALKALQRSARRLPVRRRNDDRLTGSGERIGGTRRTARDDQRYQQQDVTTISASSSAFAGLLPSSIRYVHRRVCLMPFTISSGFTTAWQ